MGRNREIMERGNRLEGGMLEGVIWGDINKTSDTKQVNVNQSNYLSVHISIHQSYINTARTRSKIVIR